MIDKESITSISNYILVYYQKLIVCEDLLRKNLKKHFYPKLKMMMIKRKSQKIQGKKLLGRKIW